MKPRRVPAAVVQVAAILCVLAVSQGAYPFYVRAAYPGSPWDPSYTACLAAAAAGLLGLIALGWWLRTGRIAEIPDPGSAPRPASRAPAPPQALPPGGAPSVLATRAWRAACIAAGLGIVFGAALLVMQVIPGLGLYILGTLIGSSRGAREVLSGALTALLFLTAAGVALGQRLADWHARQRD